MASLASAVFWLCALLLFYGHIGYPLLLWAWAKARARPPREGIELPAVTVIVIANNEARRIGARVENLLSQDYPQERLELVICSDGSTDATVALAREAAEAARAGGTPARVQVVERTVQRGKPACLNELIPEARGELVVLADARQVFEPSALRRLVAPFADPDIGAVSGELLLDISADGNNNAGGEKVGPGLYWAYEKFLRKQESAIDSTVGATGAIYALRRSLFTPIPADTVLDDMLIPCRISQSGYRVVFESRARAHDRPAEPAAELQRKARTLSGNFQLFSRELWMWNPRQNRLWLQTLSHKVLRLTIPLLLTGVFVSSVALAHQAFYGFALGCQLALYASALAGSWLARRGRHIKLLSATYLFCLLHWATVLGFLRFLRGHATAKWKKSAA